MPKPLRKVVRAKLPNLEVDGIRFDEDGLALLPDEVADALAFSSDFFRIEQFEWEEEIWRLLLIRDSGIGDLLMMTPFIRGLSMRGKVVDVLTLPKNACVFDGNPHVTQTLTADLAGTAYKPNAEDFDYRAARLEYDAVIDLRRTVERMETNGYERHRVDSYFDAVDLRCLESLGGYLIKPLPGCDRPHPRVL